MPEALTLNTPVTPTAPTTSTYRISALNLLWDAQRITVVLKDNNGALLVATYDGAVATSLMTALNKANLSTSSLQKRVLQQLATDGKLPGGSITGTPD